VRSSGLYAPRAYLSGWEEPERQFPSEFATLSRAPELVQKEEAPRHALQWVSHVGQPTATKKQRTDSNSALKNSNQSAAEGKVRR